MIVNIPKDRLIIVEHYYGIHSAIWSEADEKFVYAEPLTDLYNGAWNMKYFETRYVDESEVFDWNELEMKKD